MAGDRDAFRTIVQRYQTSLTQLACYYVGSPATADDVVQDTWIAVLKGAERFEGRSSFKTWLFHIAANRARTTAYRERRQIPVDPVDPVSADRFNEEGMWKEAPVSFADVLADAESDARVVAIVRRAIDALPDVQRSVVTLRDVEGLSTSEVADILDLSEANVRVVLHRARARLREVVETETRGEG